jgi:hypothetical protein
VGCDGAIRRSRAPRPAMPRRGDEIGRGRVFACLQHADRVGAAGSVLRRSRYRHHGLRSRLGAEGLGAAGTRPSDYLVDGGFTKDDDIEWAHQSGIKLWCPLVHSKHGSDPCAPRPDDKPAVADWPHGSSPWAEGPRRMASESGKALYKERAKAECANAWARRMGLTRLLVRQRQGSPRAAVVRARPQHAADLHTAVRRHDGDNLR